MDLPKRRALLVWAALAVAALAVGGIVGRALWPDIFAPGPDAPALHVRLPPDRLFVVARVPITNTLLSEWLSMLVVIVLFAGIRWNPKGRLRLLKVLTEAFLEAMWNYVVRAAGHRPARWLFPIAATMVVFIGANALVALLPLYGSAFVALGDGAHVPLFRSAATDINMPLALAIVSTVVVESSGLIVLRRSYLQRFLPLHNLLRGRFIRAAVDLYIGAMECLMEVSRTSALMVRLFGSMTAAEILIAVIMFLAPLVLGIPFRGLELLLAAVQAWIFSSLTVLFAAYAMTPSPAPAGEDTDA